jgi:O-antigen/teichoic acid export membrane protein
MSIRKDAAFSLTAALAPVVLALATTPFYLRVIGSDRFGILAICWTILGAATLTSLGLGPALTYRLALMGEDAPADRSKHVWMALLISVVVSSLVAWFVLVIAQSYFQRFVSLPVQLKDEAKTALPFLAVLLPLSTLSGVLNGALQGRKRFGALSAINILVAVAIMTIPLLTALLVSVELPTLILGMVIPTGLVLLAQLAICARAVPLHFPPSFRREHVTPLLSYGAWMSITALIAPFLLLFDRLVVGSLRGPTALATYVLAAYMLQGLLLVPASLSRAMLPQLTSLSTEQDVQQLQSSWLLWLDGLLTPLSLIAIAFAGPFFHFWIGPALGQVATPVAAILLVGGWVHGIGHIPSTVVVARSRPDLLAKLLLACLFPYLLLLYFATARFGVVGAAAAWTLRAAFDPLLFLYIRPSRSDVLRIATSALQIVCAMAVALALVWTSAFYWASMILLITAAAYQNRAQLRALMGEIRCFRTT